MFWIVDEEYSEGRTFLLLLLRSQGNTFRQFTLQ